MEGDMIEEVQQLKEEVRKMLVAVVENPIDKLKLVDSIQKLGVFYHFEKEIDQVLEETYVAFKSSLNNQSSDEDLNTVALLFRLLRQQGYKVPCDIFSKFVEDNGKFKETLRSDARGILSLYEATHMRVHGEDLLEEALDFSTKHLKQIVENSSSPFTTEISNALKLPIRRALPRVKARDYIEIYQQDPSHNDALLAFSKLDFNILQKLHQSELKEITRWDISMINLLPEYMKVHYITLLRLYEEMDKEMAKDGTSYRAHFAKEAVISLAESYLKEAEWLNKKYKPKFEEYMEVALDSTAYALLPTISFVCMGDIATKAVFDWLSDKPKILKASCIICRLMDDIVSSKFEKEREHVVSAVECYMDNYGCSEEETYAEFRKQLEDAWKNINESCLRPMTVPKPFLLRVLNLSRFIALLYCDEDGYTNSKDRTKLLIQSILVDPV
ncbi:unnamed protein product [Citrullus colocynthis]|uniref:Uncharacterized protein n=1 Tax=Citrullus colocynthis TaxID=252529 RepID=A0ABP0YQV1_9ROSI